MSNVSKRMNATITTGEYTNAQGEQKKSYATIGTLFIYEDGGMSLKLDALPIGNGNINFYDIKPKDQNTQQTPQYSQPQGQPQQQNYQQPVQQQQGQQQIGTAPNGSPIYG